MRRIIALIVLISCLARGGALMKNGDGNCPQSVNFTGTTVQRNGSAITTATDLALKLDISSIDDTAGDGDTDKIWSADKIYDSLQTISPTWGNITGLIADNATLQAALDAKQATVDWSNVTITGGTITGITDLAIADGGTGASTADGARAALGLTIGTDVQAYSANLATFAGIAPAANVQSILNAADYAAIRALLDLEPETDVQAYDAVLADIAGLTLAAGDVMYYDGTNIVNLTKGEDGQYLSLSAGLPAWATVDALPDQTGNSGRYITTDGTNASWAAIDALPDQSGHEGGALITNGTAADWATIDISDNTNLAAGTGLTLTDDTLSVDDDYVSNSGGDVMAGTLEISDSATTAPLKITERSTAPSSPASGQIYLDDGTNTASTAPGWRRYNGAAWEDIGATAAAPDIGSLSEDATPGVGDELMIYDSGTSTNKKISWASLPGAGSGEANTAANVGTAGVGIYDSKDGVQLKFKKINAASSKITVTDDTGNDEIDIDVSEANLAIQSIGGTQLTHEKGGLEADVSAYSGLIKVSGGSTSAVTITAAGAALLDDADAAAQRTTLGLGTAATLTAGTSASNVVQLDGSGKLPAVDGSALTNLPASGGGGTHAGTAARLTEITTIATTAGAVYTCDGTDANLTLIVIHNANTTTENVKLYNVPDNGGAVGTAGATNLMWNEDIVAGETTTIELPVGFVLTDVNDTIQAVTDTASKVTIQILGYTGADGYSRLAEITTIGTSAGAVYTNPSSTTTHIRLIVLHNTNTATETVKLYTVPDSGGSVGTAATTNESHNLEMPENKTTILEFPEPGIILSDANETIQAVADTASKVTIQIFGSTE